MQKCDTIILTVALSVIVIFTLFRFTYLAEIPAGFFVDESSIGYNVQRLLRGATDEHGAYLPLYFKAFGDYKNPVFVYSLLPIVALFGEHIVSIRIAAALWVLAALVAFLLMGKAAGFRRLSLVSMMLLCTTSPWLIQLGRVGFEVASAPVFVLIAVIAYYHLTSNVHTHDVKHRSWLYTFVVACVLGFYSYTSLRFCMPVIVAAGLFFIRKHISVKSRVHVFLLILLLSLPIFVSQSVHTGALSARYAVVGLSHYTHTGAEFVNAFVNNAFSHFSPTFLFAGGDGNLRHVPAPYGVFLITAIPFFILGMWWLYSTRNTLFSRWLITSMVVGIVPSALTIQSPHVLRAVVFLTLSYVVASFGVRFALEHSGWLRLVGKVCTIALAVQACFFLYFYTHTYSQNSRIWFDAGTVEALAHINHYMQPLYISTQLYPGTYVTAYFFATARNIDLQALNFIDPNDQLVKGPGTYIYDYQSCQQLLQKHPFPVAIYDDGICVFVLQ